MNKPSSIYASVECVLFLQGAELIIVIARKKRVWYRQLIGLNVNIGSYLPTECLSPEEIVRIEAWWDSSETNIDLEYLWDELGPILEGMETGTRPDWIKVE